MYMYDAKDGRQTLRLDERGEQLSVGVHSLLRFHHEYQNVRNLLREAVDTPLTWNSNLDR
jgi:hypothetical protein